MIGHKLESRRNSCYRKTYSISFLKDIRLNIAIEQNNKSFLKLTIKVRDKIVSDGLNDESFDATNKGKHVDANEFNKLLEDPETICLDVRNRNTNLRRTGDTKRGCYFDAVIREVGV